MSTPLMIRKLCAKCQHLHSVYLIGRCSCCRKDWEQCQAKAAQQEENTDE